MIGKRGQAKEVAGKALGSVAKGAAGVAGSAASSGLTGLKAAGSKVGVAAIGASAYTLNKGAESLGQSKDALVGFGPALLAFVLTVVAHFMAVGSISFIGVNLFVSGLLYTFSFLILWLSIVFRPNNQDKFRDILVIIMTGMLMGMVQGNPYYLLIMMVIIWAIYYFSDREHFSETGIMLMLLLLAFYLDIGLLSSILTQIPAISGAVGGLEHIILLTPWMGLVIVFTILPTTSGYVNVIKMLFIGWYGINLLGAILTGAGLLGEFGDNFQESVMMNLDNKAAASEQVLNCPSDGILTLQCLKEQLSSPGEGTIDACVLRKKEDCIDEHACREAGRELDLEVCMQEMRTARSEQSGIQGRTDMNADRFVYATLAIDTEYTDKTFVEGEFNEMVMGVPFNLDIKNPLGTPLDIQVSCMFEKGSGDNKQEVAGLILYGATKEAVHTTSLSTSEQMTRTCIPTLSMNGTWNMKVQTDILNIVSYSYLNRLLVHQWDSTDDTLTSALSNFDSVSLGANELARLNFAVGDPVNQKYIESEDFLTFQASVENVANGKVTRVSEYYVDSSDVIEYFQDNCIERYDIQVPDLANDLYTISQCTAKVTEALKARLQSSVGVEPYIVYTFEGRLVFDYRLEDKKRVSYNMVRVVS